MYNKTILDNNVTLLTHHMPGAYSVSIGVWLKIGSRYEDDARAGISHLLEHMVFKGSKKFDGDTIKRHIEGRGGLLNGFTSEEVTCYLAKVPHKIGFPTGSILLDMALNPLLKPLDLQRERTVIIEEIKMYKDLPDHMVQEQLEEAMWPRHPLGRNIAGSIESVSAITREDLEKFNTAYYQPANMVVVFAGNVRHRECIEFLRSTFKAEKRRMQFDPYSFERFSSKQTQAIIKARAKDIEQTKLAIGFPAYERLHPKRYAALLLSVILGGNMSSRLFDKVREKRGLAYAISSQYKRLIDTGAFYIHAGLDTSKLELAIELILKELRSLKHELVPGAELGRAQEFSISQLAMSLEDTLDHMVFLGESMATSNQCIGFEEIKRSILKVKPRHLREVAQDIFQEGKISVSLVGPIKEFKQKSCSQQIHALLG